MQQKERDWQKDDSKGKLLGALYKRECMREEADKGQQDTKCRRVASQTIRYKKVRSSLSPDDD